MTAQHHENGNGPETIEVLVALAAGYGQGRALVVMRPFKMRTHAKMVPAKALNSLALLGKLAQQCSSPEALKSQDLHCGTAG